MLTSSGQLSPLWHGALAPHCQAAVAEGIIRLPSMIALVVCRRGPSGSLGSSSLITRPVRPFSPMTRSV